MSTPSLASWAASHWLSVAQRLAVSCPDAGLSALFAGVGASMSVCECGLLPWEKSHFVPSCGTERLVLGPERTFTHPSPLSRVLKETCLSSPSEATALPSCQSPAHSPWKASCAPRVDDPWMAESSVLPGCGCLLHLEKKKKSVCGLRTRIMRSTKIFFKFTVLN